MIEQLKVNELPNSMKRLIPSNYHDIEVKQAITRGRLETARHLTNLLNFRFIAHQIGLSVQETTQRQLWYMCEDLQGGRNDIGGNNQYTTFLGMIRHYCEKIAETLGYDYWGYVLDDLNVTAKYRATMYDIDLNPTLLNVNALPKFEHIPFFLVIAEKEDPLKTMLRELKARGFTRGFYGLETQGYSSTNVIRLIKHLSKENKFYVYIAHDMDIDGLKIFFDIKRYIDANSIGINLRMLEYVGLKFDDIAESYKNSTGKATNKQVKGSYTMLEELVDCGISDEDYNEYKAWIEKATNQRFELDQLFAYRLMEDLVLSKGRDLVDYLLNLMEGREHDLNRYKVPYKPEKESWELKEVDYGIPEELDSFNQCISQRVRRIFRKILQSHSMESDSSWKDEFREKYEELIEDNEDNANEIRDEIEDKFKEIVEDNESYTDTLDIVDDYIDKQEIELNDLFEELWNEYELKIEEQQTELNKTIYESDIFKKILKKYSITYRKIKALLVDLSNEFEFDYESEIEDYFDEKPEMLLDDDETEELLECYKCHEMKNDCDTIIIVGDYQLAKDRYCLECLEKFGKKCDNCGDWWEKRGIDSNGMCLDCRKN